MINTGQSLNPWLGGYNPSLPMGGLDSLALSRLGGLTPGTGPAAPGAGGGADATGIITQILSLLSGLMGGAANTNSNGAANTNSNGASNSSNPSTDTNTNTNTNTNGGSGVSTSVGNLPPGLAPYAKDFEEAGRQYGVDPKFLAAISMVETGDGTSSAFKNKGNAMGISNASGPTQQSSVRDSIFKMAKTLSNPNGPYKGKRTLEEIGAVYAPVGASNDPNGTNGGWPAMVRKKMAQLGGNPNSLFTGNPNTMYA